MFFRFKYFLEDSGLRVGLLQGVLIILILSTTAAADENQILITEDSFEKIRESFKCQKVGSVNFKNKSNPVIVYEVLE